ncbi:MAG: heme-copper oxidase subunit III [Myxococcales bacterium]|nr:heme-copper oxidase subunit III [Myxococcales bacterium]
MAAAGAIPRPVRGAPIIESEVVAMVIVVFCEVMFFAGFLSGFSLIGARAPAGWWPPPGDPALPVAATGGASLALLISGVAVFWAGRRLVADRAAALRLLWSAVAFASAFLVYQVYEFVRLVSVGFTMVSSAHGGFFYTIVGAHALHAVIAVAVLSWAVRRLSAGDLRPPAFTAVRMYWYFVVGLWPAIYSVVYL